MIVQFEGAKRTLTFIFGKHVGDPDDEVFVSNTSGDFDPAPSDDDDLDDDDDAFGFRPQRVAARCDDEIRGLVEQRSYFCARPRGHRGTHSVDVVPGPSSMNWHHGPQPQRTTASIAA